MSDQNQYRTQRVPNALDEIKLRLSAEPVAGSKRRPSLKVSTSRNNIHMMVFTNVEGDQEGGRIAAQMDSVSFFMFLEALERVIKAKEPMKRTISNTNFVWNQGKRSDAPKLVSNTIIEKEADGSIYMSIVNNKATPVKFYFMPSEFHTLVKEDGTPVSRAELTATYAAAWCKIIGMMATNVLAANYVEPQPRDNSGWGNKGGNGGGNRSQGGGGFGNASPDAKEPGMNPDWGSNDDFPM